jgi:chromosome segregation ATPase
MSGIAEEIRKALAKATPGPWEWQRKNFEETNSEGGYDLYDLMHWKNQGMPRNGIAVLTAFNDKWGYPVISAFSYYDALIIANAPEWLRWQQGEIERLKSVEHTLCLTIGEADKAIRQSREENERLKNEIKSHGPEGRNYTNAQYVELRLEIERLREQVDSLLEEKEGWQVVADRGWHEAGEEVKKREELEFQLQQLRKELEQVKKERDAYYNNAKYTEAAFHGVTKLRAEIEFLQSQLSEKDKVLEWYADEDTHEIKRRVLGDFAPISLDKGQRARDILAKYAKEEETK